MLSWPPSGSVFAREMSAKVSICGKFIWQRRGDSRRDLRCFAKMQSRGAARRALFFRARIEGPLDLPDLASFFAHHGIALFAAEGLCEFRHVRERSVHAELWEGMGIGLGHQPRILDPLVRAPDLRQPRKKRCSGVNPSRSGGR